MRRARRGLRNGRTIGQFNEAKGNMTPSLAIPLAVFICLGFWAVPSDADHGAELENVLDAIMDLVGRFLIPPALAL